VKKLGQVLHQAKSGNLIVKAEVFLKPSIPVFDASGKKIGFVVETFGPISSPYVSVKPTTDRVRKLIGEQLYVRMESG
jgi:rRNA processing protein Gar1